MRIELLPSFVTRLEGFIEFVAMDKPSAAREFKNSIIRACKEIGEFPYRHRKSIYFNDETIRDLIFRGFVVIYKIEDDVIKIFAFINKEQFDSSK